MKNSAKTLALLVFVVVSSCEKDLDQHPISIMSEDVFYNNTADFEQAVNGIYSVLRFYPDYQLFLSEIRSDNIYSRSPSDGVHNFARNIVSDENINSIWSLNYMGIMRSNIVLDKLNEMAVPDEVLRKRFEGEARFLRAFFYFDLVRWFGPVPINEYVTTPEESLKKGRSPVEEVYHLIISDLEAAIDLLPQSYNTANMGRVTSYAAKGILARVYLTRSGPKLHPDGPCLESNEYDKALNLLNEIIAGPFELLDDYADVFAQVNENNDEIILDVQYISQFGVGASYPTVLASEQWWISVGLPFEGRAGNRGSVSADLIDSYGSNDARFFNDIQLEYMLRGVPVLDNPTCVKFASTDQSTWGVFRDDFGTNFPLLRFSDVLLMKAECILQGSAGGTQQDVDELVNRIRARAGLVDEPLTDVKLDDLLEERRKEFLGEGLRWHDLVRTARVLDLMNEWIPRVNVANNINHPIGVNYILYPIPFSQIEMKEGLYDQNDGY